MFYKNILQNYQMNYRNLWCLGKKKKSTILYKNI